MDAITTIANGAEGAQKAGTCLAVPLYAISQTISVVNSIANNRQMRVRIDELKRRDAETDSFETRKLRQDLEFLRKSYEENIASHAAQVKQQFENLRSQSDFAFFCDKFWKDLFGMTINSLQYPLAELADSRPEEMRVQLMVARTVAIDNLTAAWGPARDQNYRTLCSHIKERTAKGGLFSTSFINGWRSPSRGTSADTMMLYYVMQGIPTVILFLEKEGDRLSVEVAMWSLHQGLDNFLICRPLEVVTTDENQLADAYDLLSGAAAYCGDMLRRGLSMKSSKSGMEICGDIRSAEIKKLVSSLYAESDEAFEKSHLNLLTI